MLVTQLFLKIFSGMSNSVDPDQTVPSGSGTALLCHFVRKLVYEILGHLSYFFHLYYFTIITLFMYLFTFRNKGLTVHEIISF